MALINTGNLIIDTRPKEDKGTDEVKTESNAETSDSNDK
jgi:hypothetical protein